MDREQLGVQLFSRAHNKLSLTPAGIRLYEAVNTGFNTIVDGTRCLNLQELSGRLVIACTQTIASLWATQTICSFHQKYPSIEIDIREITDSRELSEFAKPQLYPVCSPRLLKGCKAIRKAKDLFQFPIIHDNAVPWSRWFEHHGASHIEPPKNIYFPNTSQALIASRLGHGVALGNSFETQWYIENGELIQLLDDMPIEEQHAYFFLRANPEYRPLKVQIFEDWIRRTFA